MRCLAERAGSSGPGRAWLGFRSSPRHGRNVLPRNALKKLNSINSKETGLRFDSAYGCDLNLQLGML